MNSIRNKIRYLLGDISTNASDVFTYDNTTTFTLSESNTIAITDVYVNNVASAVTHTFNSALNKVQVTSSLSTGDTIQVDYTCYPNYSDTELNGYIQAALIHISNNNYYDFDYDSTTDAIYPVPTTKEENLIALIAATLINPDNRSIRLPDITLGAPSDSVSVDTLINKIISRYKKDTHGIFDIVGGD